MRNSVSACVKDLRHGHDGGRPTRSYRWTAGPGWHCAGRVAKKYIAYVPRHSRGFLMLFCLQVAKDDHQCEHHKDSGKLDSEAEDESARKHLAAASGGGRAMPQVVILR
jgi:hypothetical protein